MPYFSNRIWQTSLPYLNCSIGAGISTEVKLCKKIKSNICEISVQNWLHPSSVHKPVCGKIQPRIGPHDITWPESRPHDYLIGIRLTIAWTRVRPQDYTTSIGPHYYTISIGPHNITRPVSGHMTLHDQYRVTLLTTSIGPHDITRPVSGHTITWPESDHTILHDRNRELHHPKEITINLSCLPVLATHRTTSLRVPLQSIFSNCLYILLSYIYGLPSIKFKYEKTVETANREPEMPDKRAVNTTTNKFQQKESCEHNNQQISATGRL